MFVAEAFQCIERSPPTWFLRWFWRWFWLSQMLLLISTNPPSGKCIRMYVLYSTLSCCHCVHITPTRGNTLFLLPCCGGTPSPFGPTQALFAPVVFWPHPEKRGGWAALHVHSLLTPPSNRATGGGLLGRVIDVAFTDHATHPFLRAEVCRHYLQCTQSRGWRCTDTVKIYNTSAKLVPCTLPWARPCTPPRLCRQQRHVEITNHPRNPRSFLSPRGSCGWRGSSRRDPSSPPSAGWYPWPGMPGKPSPI